MSNDKETWDEERKYLLDVIHHLTANTDIMKAEAYNNGYNFGYEQGYDDGAMENW